MRSNPLSVITRVGLCLAVFALTLLSVANARAIASVARDRDIILGLHTVFQMAVKRNDANTMRRILHDRFVLVRGDGERYSRAEMLATAASGKVSYEKQDEEPGTRTVQILGDTAVITARFWIKGVRDGVAFDRRLWLSDIYVRTPDGWRFAFCQASLPVQD